YSIRAFNGREFTDMQTIYLKDGEIFNFTPKWDILLKQNVYAYPNPAQNSIVNIHYETDAFNEVIIVIFDITGRVLKKFSGNETVSDGTGYKAVWDFSNENIASGVYLYMVKVRDPSTNDVKKVIKKLAIIR
ncbi:MAG: T9SS type A sorting domain-containing protein, partial [Elusimicrobiales bacterium]|nr:T9SS type A sorting domain-containing protein [Elusimicrobiales bacterium]